MTTPHIGVQQVPCVHAPLRCTRRRWLGAGLLSPLLAAAGCQSLPQQVADGRPPQPRIEFLDLQMFDRELGRSFAAPLSTVEVQFLDRTSPNRIPERMQLWMAAVEDGGGQVKVTPPPAPFGSRSPALLIGAIASLWSASKAVSEMAQKAQYERAKRYNAEVVLKLDKGETVIDRIVFSQKP